MAHSSADFIEDSEHRKWSPSKLLKRYGGSFVAPEELKRDIGDYFHTDGQFRERLAELPEGIHIFGHSHIQWNYMSEDGKKVLINPGACGLPVDCVKEGIQYISLFLQYMEEYAGKMGEARRPFPLPLWEKGFELWYHALFGEDAAPGN